VLKAFEIDYNTVANQPFT